MNKTKKALLAALACSAVLAGAFGLAACNGNGGGDDGHHHNYVNWTSDGDSTHTGNCDADGECDTPTKTEAHDTNGTDGACSKCGYKAEEDDPTKIKAGNKTIESLTTTGVTLTFEGLEAGKEYTLSSENDKVQFSVGMVPAGNPVTFEYGLLTHTVNVVSTEGTLTNVVIKLEEAGEGDDVSTIEFNTDVTVTTANGYDPIKYQIELEAGSYQILVDGEAIEVGNASDVVLGAWYEEGELNIVYTDVEKAMDLSENSYYYNADHIYYIEVYANVTFKVVAFEHVHTEDETTWESDSTGHWHPLTCAHGFMGEKGTVSEHDFGAWSEADADGIKTRTCETCEYKESDLSGLTATEVTGGPVNMGEWDATPVTAGTTYKTSILAQAGYSGYNPGEYFFGITCGNTPKTYKLKVLTQNTRIVNANAEAIISEAGGEYEVVLRANQTFEFGVTTLDETCESDYSCDVAFKITEGEDPTEGSIKLPFIVTEGSNTKTVEANQNVYFVVPSAYDGTLTGDLKITFGADVTVTYLGSNVENEGNPLTSGGFISDNAYANNDVYLCITSTSGAIAFNIESTIAEGKKGNPIVATFGADSANQVALDAENGVYEKWFKVTAATAGLFVVKSEADGASFEVYHSTDDDMAFLTGSRVMLDLAADETVYIRATRTGMDDSAYAFTVTEATDADRGYSASYAIAITGAGTYNIPEAILGTYGAAFFTYEATENCTVTIEHNGAEHACFVYVIADEYEEYGGKSYGASPVTINAEAGHTYIISCYPEGLADGTLTVTITPAVVEEA